MKTLHVKIMKESYQGAIEASSGACLIADEIKAQYPRLTSVDVDVATVRATDSKAGLKYVWLTPPSVADVLLNFDQGWKEEQLPITLHIRTLLRVTPITRSRSSKESRAKERASRLAELEAKEQGGTLTADEQRSLTRMRKPRTRGERPTSEGPVVLEGGDKPLVRGGRIKKIGGKNPNLLAGRNRHFGAKLATPSAVFQKALKQGVEAELARRSQGEMAFAAPMKH